MEKTLKEFLVEDEAPSTSEGNGCIDPTVTTKYIKLNKKLHERRTNENHKES